MSKKQDPTSHAGSAREAIRTVAKRGPFKTADAIAEMKQQYPGFNWSATVRHEMVNLVKVGTLRVVDQIPHGRFGTPINVYEMVTEFHQ